MSTETVTDAQRAAIDAQVASYDAPDTPCEGLHAHRIVPRGDYLLDGELPGAVVVEFQYVPEDHVAGDHLGLEVAIFGVDGTVLDAQDFG